MLDHYLIDSQNTIQCLECKGFRHIAVECANTLKRSRDKKAISITWSEDEDRTEGNQVTSQIVNLQSDADSLQ